jgi:hypothetical protein
VALILLDGDGGKVDWWVGDGRHKLFYRIVATGSLCLRNVGGIMPDFPQRRPKLPDQPSSG